MKRKILSMMMCLMLIIGLLPQTALSAGEKTVAITPSTDKPTAEASIGIGEELKLEITNGSSNSAYDYTIEADIDGIVSLEDDTVEIAKGATETIIVTGAKNGTVKLTISNGNTGSGSSWGGSWGGSTSYERLAYVTIQVGTGVTPPETGTVSITPTTDKPNVNAEVEVGETLTIKVTNGSSNSAYDFEAVSDKTGFATVSPASQNIAAGATKSFTVTGVAAGKAVITISNENEYGSSYNRVGTVTVQVVGEGGEEPVEPEEPDEPGDVVKTIKITPSTDEPTGSASIKIGEKVALEITNGSENSDYDFTVEADVDGVVSLDKDTVEIAKGDTETIIVTGAKDGTVELTISNGNTGSGSSWGGSWGGSTSYERLAYVTIQVGTGENPVTPPATGTVEITPTTDKPDVNASVEVGKTLTIKVTNGSSNNAYDFEAVSDKTGFATVSPASQNIAAGATKSFTVTGVAEGKAVITISNETQYGSQYQRVGTVTVQVVGEGGEEPDEPDVPVVTGDVTYLAFTSDVHNQSGDASSTRLANWINTLVQKNGAPFDRFGFCGDMGPAMGSSDAFWTNAQKVMNKVETDKTKVLHGGFYVCGNHEFDPGNYKHNLNDTTKKYSDAGTYVKGENYILYSLGARQYNEIYSDSDINAMKSFLDENKDFDGPIFILSHFPLHCYNGYTSGEDERVHSGKAAVGSGQIIEALNAAVDNNGQTIIFLWGHNHSSSNDHYDKVYTDKINNTAIKFVYAAAGAMSDSEYGASANVKGKGLVAAISDEAVTLKYYNANGTEVGTGATIELNGTPDPDAKYYTITVTKPAHGTITPATASVKENGSKTFTVTADAHYVLDQVLVDGKAVAVSGNTFTVSNVTKDMTVTATFTEAEGKAYTPAKNVTAGSTYIIVSNGYALVNNNGTAAAIPVEVSGDDIYMNDADVAAASWTMEAAKGAADDRAGDFVVKNNGFMVSRVSDASGSELPIEITKTEKTSEHSGLPYYQWSYTDGELSQVGGQDKTATFYVYYDTTGKAFYAASTSGTTKLYVVKEAGEVEDEVPEIDNNYAKEAEVEFEDSDTLVIENDEACVVVAKLADGAYVLVDAVKRADGSYVFDLSDIDGKFSITIGLLGDVDLDGDVDMSDATMVMLSWVDNEPFTGFAAYAADVDFTEEVDMTDATEIMLAWVNNTSLGWYMK